MATLDTIPCKRQDQGQLVAALRKSQGHGTRTANRERETS
jgi:hypothetical protein